MQTAATDGRLVIPQRIERLPMTSYQRNIGFIIVFAWLLDTIDLGGMTFMLSTLAQEFSLSTIQMGYLGSMSFAGMLVGTFIAGATGDRFGRKLILQYAMFIWGAAGLLCAVSWSMESLFCFRFLLGLGLGMELPVAHAMLPEFFPKEQRGKWVAYMEGLLPVGIIVAGIITYLVMPLVGWRWVFAIEAIPAVYIFIIRRGMPESPRWLESVGRKKEALEVMDMIEAEVEKRSGKPLPPIPETVLIEKHSQTNLSELLSKDYLKRTVMLWLLWPIALFSYYGLTTWLGALLVAKGFTISKSISFVILITTGGIPGFLTAAYLIEKIGRKPVVVTSIILTAASAYLYGDSSTITTLYIWGFLLQFFTYCMWSSIYAYTPELYPTRMRAAGCGLSSSLGRIGALLGPYLVGVVLATYGVDSVFIMAAGLFMVGALVVLILGPETKGRVLEEISQ